MNTPLRELRNSAVEFAKAGGEVTLKYYRQSYDLEYKSDHSPVTNADREAERVIRDLIKRRYPDHGIIGEEYGEENSDRDIVWVLDPIDGTKSFIHGVPFYTTLIGILINGVPEVGVIYAPALNEMVSAAIGDGCTLNGEETRVRRCEHLENATFLTTDVTSFTEFGFEKAFQKLKSRTRVHRTWGDAYGHLMVATGRADIMIDAILNVWDAAALLPILTEAGGVFCDLSGIHTINSGNALSTNHLLKEEIVQIFEK
jgi:histidinol-phosphatase